VLAGDLSGAKARLLLMVSLGLTSDPAEARQVVQLTINS
jgi:L-asparaginase/Glu-tRNA(Gln) amidotransferase subunit D